MIICVAIDVLVWTKIIRRTRKFITICDTTVPLRNFNVDFFQWLYDSSLFIIILASAGTWGLLDGEFRLIFLWFAFIDVQWSNFCLFLQKRWRLVWVLLVHFYFEHMRSRRPLVSRELELWRWNLTHRVISVSGIYLAHLRVNFFGFLSMIIWAFSSSIVRPRVVIFRSNFVVHSPILNFWIYFFLFQFWIYFFMFSNLKF